MSELVVEDSCLEKAIDFGRHFLRVGLATHAAYAEEKRKRGAIDFNDQLIMAHDLFRDHKTVRTACQRQYQFLLVDELQDTDPVKWKLSSYSSATASLPANSLPWRHKSIDLPISWRGCVVVCWAT